MRDDADALQHALIEGVEQCAYTCPNIAAIFVEGMFGNRLGEGRIDAELIDDGFGGLGRAIEGRNKEVLNIGDSEKGGSRFGFGAP